MPLLFLMLNPSTADASVDDPTIRKCRGFAQRMGRQAIVVVNLFAYRATNPRELLAVRNPIGPENDRHIAEAWRDCGGAALVAWGAFDQDLVRERARAVTTTLINWGGRVNCLGRSANGNPRHPLMLPYSTALEEYQCRDH